MTGANVGLWASLSEMVSISTRKPGKSNIGKDKPGSIRTDTTSEVAGVDFGKKKRI
jgi:hypothetical protein